MNPPHPSVVVVVGGRVEDNCRPGVNCQKTSLILEVDVLSPCREVILCVIHAPALGTGLSVLNMTQIISTLYAEFAFV